MAFGRKSKKEFLQAFVFGMVPDLFSFGIFWIATTLGFYARPNFSHAAPDESLIPAYVHTLYNVTHSLFIFAVIFLIVWFFRKRPFLPMLAWGFHILIDIPSHSTEFFATPFLWPFSDFKVNGIQWGSPIIFIPNVALLMIAYSSWFYFQSKSKKVK